MEKKKKKRKKIINFLVLTSYYSLPMQQYRKHRLAYYNKGSVSILAS